MTPNLRFSRLIQPSSISLSRYEPLLCLHLHPQLHERRGHRPVHHRVHLPHPSLRARQHVILRQSLESRLGLERQGAGGGEPRGCRSLGVLFKLILRQPPAAPRGSQEVPGPSRDLFLIGRAEVLGALGGLALDPPRLGFGSSGLLRMFDETRLDE